jgi:two-component system C4-dicarboxylate transport sensor histidine kinase DctB
MSDQPWPAAWLARANRRATIAALVSPTVHDVNNALQVMSGSAEMLTPDAPPDAIARRREAIGSQAMRASALLTQLSAFARDDTPEGRHADLGQIAHRALAFRQHTLARLRIESRLDAEAALPPVAASARDLLQIAINLLLNAEQALAGRTDPRVVVSAALRDVRAELTVDDNGPGISRDAARRLFQPAIADAMTTSGTGLGIGLAVGRWLAERNGGTLDVAPSALGGAAFTLSFPAV